MDKPWRLQEALAIPELRLGFEQRSRFEHLENDFRVTNPGQATALSMRTLLNAQLRLRAFVLAAELQDARAWAAEGTPLNTTIVNPFELLQGYVGARAQGVFAKGDTLALHFGRWTMDLGSRRLVARNEFRNTINSFWGFELQWGSAQRDTVRLFVARPVVRLPSDAEGLAHGRVDFDRENVDALLWGAFVQSRPLGGRAKVLLEGTFLGYSERDSALAPSANRRLFTPALRLWRAPVARGLDFQIEVMGQVGTSRASAGPTDTKDLEHLAMSFHASIGYRIGVPWAPRGVLQYDYASGDSGPNDGRNGRFDPLFGARRFEFGPTGFYGALSRSNMSSPGVRLELQPHRTVDAFVGYRLLWLASARDAWVAAGQRDGTGQSGTFVGPQVEARVRWHVLPMNLVLDVGGAVLVPGEFAKSAPGGSEHPSVYGYAQVTTTL